MHFLVCGCLQQYTKKKKKMVSQEEFSAVMVVSILHHTMSRLHYLHYQQIHRQYHCQKENFQQLIIYPHMYSTPLGDLSIPALQKLLKNRRRKMTPVLLPPVQVLSNPPIHLSWAEVVSHLKNSLHIPQNQIVNHIPAKPHLSINYPITNSNPIIILQATPALGHSRQS